MRAPFLHRSVVSLLVAAFMVLVLPACWYGAVARAAAAGTQGPSSSNNNEEHEEREKPGTHKLDVVGRRPPPPQRHAHRVVRARANVTERGTTAGSVAPVLHPSRFSVRRLI